MPGGQTLPDRCWLPLRLAPALRIAVHDPEARVGGLLHFMLPDSSIDPGRGRKNPSMFADLAIPALLHAVAQLGAAPARLVAHAAGGAQMMGDERIFDIGRRNCEAMRRHLDAAGYRAAPDRRRRLGVA